MIRTAHLPGGLSLTAQLPAATRAYVDLGWVSTGEEAEVPALLVDDGTATGPDGSTLDVGPLDVDTLARCVLATLARNACAALADSDVREIEITGSGAVADEVRRLLGAPAPRARPRQKGAARPAAVVETTGRPETVVLATKRVCDMGTVVLAGPVPGGRLDLNVYRDVHRRGLRVVGVPLLAGDVDMIDLGTVAPPTPVAPGSVLPAKGWVVLAA